MAFLHCHNCDFQQDDFWHIEYNPARQLLKWEKYLLSGAIDEPFTDDVSFIEQHGNLTIREVIAREFERYAKIIRNMPYRTDEELREKNPNFVCPKCGKQTLDID